MAVQNTFYGVNGDLTTFPQTKHIQNKDYVRVYVRQKIDSVWILYDATKYDVINNAIVFDSPIDPTIYDMIEIRIADSVDELVDSISDIAIVASIHNDVSTVSSVATDVTTVATDITNVNTVATSIANVNTVATDIANVNTVAADIANVNAVGTNIFNVNTVGTNMTNVTTVATDIANVNTVGTDINITNINTVATDIANVNTVATNIANVNNVSANIDDVNNFGKTYYGSLISDPTVRPDGTAMLSGDLYFNTFFKEMRVYDGVVWKTTTDSYTKTEADSRFPKLETPNKFVAYPQDIQSDINSIGYFGGVRQDGTRQYLLGATGSTTPLDLKAYDIDGITVLGRISFASNGDANIDGGVIRTNGNVVWHAGNDGAGSGLDADLIHGKTLQTTFDQIYYVDAVNGNDLNDGSSTSPFATLNKAVDSIIVGGRGTINLLSDITVSTAILAKKKDIYISGIKSDGTKFIITFNTYVEGLYNTLAGFRLADGCNIGFINCIINFDLTGIDTTLTFDSFAQVVSYATGAASLTSVRLFQCDVNLPDDSTYALVHSNGAGTMIALSMYSTTVNSAGVNSFLAKITAGSLIYNSYSVTLSGAKTAHADVISGVIRDANGLPRNILSNIII